MKISVVGLGYVGLPVACAFAKAGVMVYGVDKNINLIGNLKDKLYNYKEPGLNEVLDSVLNRNLIVSDKITVSDVYIITVQTPINDDKSADNSYVENAFIELADYIKNDDIVILESTVSIGSNKRFYDTLRTRVNENIQFTYCYCPESILPGNIFHEIETNNRVIGGMNEQDLQKVKHVYDIINKGNKELTSIPTAEFVKLVQNSHRDVELAFVNQLSIMCDIEGVNVFDVIKIANNHPRCNLLEPSSGVGGHCIAVDPYFLIERYKDSASLLKTARNINNYKPIYIAEKAIKCINYNKSKTIGVLGLSYKANSEDCRESSGIKILKYLQELGYKVIANEINVKSSIIMDIVNAPVDDILKSCDVIIIAQKHSMYENIDFSNKNVIDCVNMLK